MSILWLILGFLLLVVGGEFLVRSSVALSFKLNISKLVIGMTVVSFATSMPELLVSLNAALKGSADLAINNVVGSNIANIGLVLGITAIVGAIDVKQSFYKFELPVLFLFSLVLYYVLSNDGVLTTYEGVGLFLALILFLVLLIRRTKKDTQVEDVDDKLAAVTYFKIFIWLVIGGVALFYGSNWLVNGATELAKQVGVSQAVIGATVVAIGTSVPELAASVIAAAKQEKALSLGNLIGSNIFNIGSVLGLTSIIKPIFVTDPNILSKDIFWMLGFAFIILPLTILPKRFQISRVKGFLLVFAYSIFILMQYM